MALPVAQLDPRPLIRDLLDSYRTMEMPLDRYLKLYLLPMVLMAVMLAVIAVAAPDLPAWLRGLIAALGGFLPLAVLVMPKAKRDSQRRQIRQRFHLFLTHLTVLSMTNIDRVEIFRTLADTDEYLAIAEEMGHIVALVDTWNQSLDDACRMRAKKVPSPLLSDFLERLAYSIGAGQQISDFLIEEQDTMIQNFATRYESDLAKLDVMKELFMSMMMAVSFLLSFAIILPVLTGINPMMPVMGVVGVFLLTEAGFLYGIHASSPSDPLWFDSERRLPRDRRILIVTSAAVVSSLLIMLILGVGVFFEIGTVTEIPLSILMAMPTTPFLIPGYIMGKQESRVRDRDKEFVSFIRALGAVETVKQTSTANVLASLRRKDFGNLTQNIDNLYKRLNMRIDTTRSWRLFADETGSYLIQKFGDMYVFGRRLGGDPKALGNVISGNMNEVMTLREKRQQSTKTIVGVLYGLTAALVFAFFVSMEVVEMLLDITGDMDMLDEMGMQLLYTEGYDVLQIRYMLLIVVLLNALFASIMIRVTDRGHFLNSLTHFTLLTWLGGLTAWVTAKVTAGAITV